MGLSLPASEHNRIRMSRLWWRRKGSQHSLELGRQVPLWPEPESDEPQHWQPPTSSRCFDERRGGVLALFDQDLPPHVKLRRQKSERAMKPEREPKLPPDPRNWNREDVSVWLEYMVQRNGLPIIPPDSFMMNGKGLCLMTMDMFTVRAPLGGKTLFKDFQLRLTDALHEPSAR